MKRTMIHRMFAYLFVWKRIGATHWSSGPNYTYDSSCPFCVLFCRKRAFKLSPGLSRKESRRIWSEWLAENEQLRIRAGIKKTEKEDE